MVKSPFLLIVKAVTSPAFASETLNIIDLVTANCSIFKSPVLFLNVELLPSCPIITSPPVPAIKKFVSGTLTFPENAPFPVTAIPVFVVSNFFELL